MLTTASQDLFDVVPDGLNANVTGWLVYDNSKTKPDAKLIGEFAPFDDFSLVPYDKEGIYSNVDQSITLDMKMDNLDDGANYAFFNDITYVAPKVPVSNHIISVLYSTNFSLQTLYTALSTGTNATNALIYGHDTNPFVLAQNQVVEIILNNDDPGKHPFHLHGHVFQVVARSEEEAGAFDPNNSTQTAFAPTPMRRDTVLVRPNGHIVLRFQSNNPGIWLFVRFSLVPRTSTCTDMLTQRSTAI
jgi:iron transport multicopper oxidase